MVDRLLARLRTSLDTVTRGWMTVLAGDVARMALGFGVSILTTRALGPADFGVYTVLGAVVGIAGAIADFGLSQAAVKRISRVWARERGPGRERGRAFVWVRLGLATLVVAGGVVLARPLVPLLGLPDAAGVSATSLLVLALLGVLATAASGAMSTLLQATARFGRISLVLVANTGLTLVLAAILAGTGRLTLLTALLVLGIVPSLFGFGVGRRLLPGRWRLSPPARPVLRREASDLLRFGRWLWLSNVLAVLTLQLDVLLLNRLGAAATVGVYGLALNLATKIDVVNRSLYTVLLPTVSALQGWDEYGRYLRRGVGRGALICLLLVPAFFLAQPFVVFFYGVEYAPAGALFRWLLAVVALDVLTMPFLLLAFPLNRPRWLAAAEALRAFTMFAGAVSLIPAFGPVGAVGARFAARSVGFLFILLLLWRQRRGR